MWEITFYVKQNLFCRKCRKSRPKHKQKHIQSFLESAVYMTHTESTSHRACIKLIRRTEEHFYSTPLQNISPTKTILSLSKSLTDFNKLTLIFYFRKVLIMLNNCFCMISIFNPLCRCNKCGLYEKQGPDYQL